MRNLDMLHGDHAGSRELTKEELKSLICARDREKKRKKWLSTVKEQRQTVQFTSETKVIQMFTEHSSKTATVLSDRELEVLQLLSFGNTTREVSKKLHISEHTVINHRKNMIERSHCSNLLELIRVALKENLI